MMLRVAREVAWLRLGSYTDHVVNAAAASPARTIRPSPINSRNRRTSASRIDAGSWPTRGMTRSIDGMCPRCLTQNLDQAMQRLAGRLTVGDQRKADVACAWIETIALLSRQIAAGNHAHAGVAIESYRCRLVAALLCDIEPDAEAAGRALVAVAIAEDLVGEIELDAIELAVLFDMRLVAIGGGCDLLQRHRHLRGCDIAQLVEGGEKCLVAGGKADAHARQV